MVSDAGYRQMGIPAPRREGAQFNLDMGEGS
jgi:hypothetical protein